MCVREIGRACRKTNEEKKQIDKKRSRMPKEHNQYTRSEKGGVLHVRHIA